MELLHTDFIHPQKHWWRSKKSLTLECHNLFIGLSYTLEKLQTLSTHNKNTTDRITAENFFFWLFWQMKEATHWGHRWPHHGNHAELLWWSGFQLDVKVKNSSQMSQKKPQKNQSPKPVDSHTCLDVCMCFCFHANYLSTLDCQMMCAAQPAHARAVFSAFRAEFYLRFQELLTYRCHHWCHLKWPFTLIH